jgi:hypothetical protein
MDEHFERERCHSNGFIFFCLKSEELSKHIRGTSCFCNFLFFVSFSILAITFVLAITFALANFALATFALTLGLAFSTFDIRDVVRDGQNVCG